MESISDEQQIHFCGHLALMLIHSWQVQEIAADPNVRFMEDAYEIFKKRSKLNQIEVPSDELIRKAVVDAGTKSHLIDQVISKIKEMNWNIEINRLTKKLLTCVYCGHEYPEGTPSSQSQILTDHIAQCEKHPMKVLRDALAFYARSLDADDAKSVIEAWHKDNFGEKARKAFEQLGLKYES